LFILLGVSLGILSVSHANPYYIYFFGSVAEFIGYFLCSLNDKLGRKKTLIGFLVLSALSCLLVAILPQESETNSSSDLLKWNVILNIFFALFGKSMVSAASNSGFIYVSQLYPTGVRAFFLSLVSSIGRFGKYMEKNL